MGTMPKTGIRTPAEYTDPFNVNFDDEHATDIDNWVDANASDKLLTLVKTGTFALDAAGNTLHFPEFKIYSARYGDNLVVSAGSVAMNNGEIVYVANVPRPFNGNTLALVAGAWPTAADGARDVIPVAVRNGTQLRVLIPEMKLSVSPRMPDGRVDISSTTTIDIADNGKAIVIESGYTATLPAAQEGLNFFIASQGPTTPGILGVPAPGLIGSYGKFYPTPWTAIQIPNQPGYLHVSAQEVSPGSWMWFMASCDIAIINNADTSMVFNPSVGDYARESHEHVASQVTPWVDDPTSDDSPENANNLIVTNDAATANLTHTLINGTTTQSEGARIRFVQTNATYSITVKPQANDLLLCPDGLDTGDSGTPFVGLRSKEQYAELTVALVKDTGGTGSVWVVESMRGLWEDGVSGMLYRAMTPYKDNRSSAEQVVVPAGGNVAFTIEAGNIKSGIMELVKLSKVSGLSTDIVFEILDQTGGTILYQTNNVDLQTADYEDRNQWWLEVNTAGDLACELRNNDGANAITIDVVVRLKGD